MLKGWGFFAYFEGPAFLENELKLKTNIHIYLPNDKCDNFFGTAYGITIKQVFMRKEKIVPAQRGVFEIVERKLMCLHKHYQLATEVTKNVHNKIEEP